MSTTKIALSPEEVDIIIDALQTWSAALSSPDHVDAASPNAAYTHAMDALANRLVTVRGTV